MSCILLYAWFPRCLLGIQHQSLHQVFKFPLRHSDTRGRFHHLEKTFLSWGLLTWLPTLDGCPTPDLVWHRAVPRKSSFTTILGLPSVTVWVWISHSYVLCLPFSLLPGAPNLPSMIKNTFILSSCFIDGLAGITTFLIPRI